MAVSLSKSKSSSILVSFLSLKQFSELQAPRKNIYSPNIVPLERILPLLVVGKIFKIQQESDNLGDSCVQLPLVT